MLTHFTVSHCFSYMLEINGYNIEQNSLLYHSKSLNWIYSILISCETLRKKLDILVKI